jgi:hypothetical protein
MNGIYEMMRSQNRWVWPNQKVIHDTFSKYVNTPQLRADGFTCVLIGGGTDQARIQVTDLLANQMNANKQAKLQQAQIIAQQRAQGSYLKNHPMNIYHEWRQRGGNV